LIAGAATVRRAAAASPIIVFLKILKASLKHV